MTLTIELTPEEEFRLQAAARSAGIEAAEWAPRLLAEYLPTVASGQATRELLRVGGRSCHG